MAGRNEAFVERCSVVRVEAELYSDGKSEDDGWSSRKKIELMHTYAHLEAPPTDVRARKSKAHKFPSTLNTHF